MAKALTKRQTLTFPKINSLKTTGKRYEIRDTEIGGLCVRVSEKGVKTFVLKKRYPGSDNPTRRALGEVGVLTLEEAREKARQWVKLIKQGIDPSEVERLAREAEAQKRKNTFAAAVEDFIADKVSKERRGRVVEQEIRREFLPAWGDRPIYEITPKEIAALIRTKARHAPPQARNLLALLKRFFKGELPRNDIRHRSEIRRCGAGPNHAGTWAGNQIGRCGGYGRTMAAHRRCDGGH